MTYLQDKLQFNFNSNLYQLNKIENDIKREVLMRKVRNEEGKLRTDQFVNKLDWIRNNNMADKTPLKFSENKVLPIAVRCPN